MVARFQQFFYLQRYIEIHLILRINQLVLAKYQCIQILTDQKLLMYNFDTHCIRYTSSISMFLVSFFLFGCIEVVDTDE